MMTFVPLDHASTLDFPCTACACFEHVGTGEGRTIGLLVMYANSEQALRHVVEQEFGSYYVAGAYVGLWDGVPEGFEALNPGTALQALDAIFESRPSFLYSAKLRYNAA